jgi:hypothetical protein
MAADPVDTKENRVSDQAFDDPGQDSIDADREAAVNDTEDDDGFPPADRAGSVLADPDLDNEEPETSHDADVAAGFDEED